jgi:hypothetical protein
MTETSRTDITNGELWLKLCDALGIDPGETRSAVEAFGEEARMSRDGEWQPTVSWPTECRRRMTNMETWLRLCEILGVENAGVVDRLDLEGREESPTLRFHLAKAGEGSAKWWLSAERLDAPTTCVGIRLFVLNVAPWEKLPGGSGYWNGFIKFLERQAADMRPRPRTWLAGAEVVTEGQTLDDLFAGRLDAVARAWRVSRL